ncbi:DUF943 family protein [Advenella alkanexedens]|uniref:DUF943 family protein n=1 Tax=Advenella alkanexedens TaxID=1481665 RepID=UPI002674AB90|nr:DUF943 family protein [Advenella alkanexedens]WKU19355.1 DUF943 family protein [Advenella alkanexedens]
MKLKIKFQFLLILPVFFLVWLGVNYGYRYFQPMEVVDILPAHEGFLDAIILKNPPLNEQDFIRWWQENKEEIRTVYHIPTEHPDVGFYSISVWDIGDGYEINKKGQLKEGVRLSPFAVYSQNCFLMLPQKARCLNKENRYADIGKAVSGWHYINFSSGNEYIQNDKGEFVKRKKPER